MNIALYTLTSALHDKSAVDAVSQEFLSSIEAVLGFGLDFRGDDFSSYGQSDLDVIFIRTGGSEGLFKAVFPTLKGNVLLLTSGKSNSLAASLEILSFLNQQGRRGEVLHGSAEYIADRMLLLARVNKARQDLRGRKLGIIGKPSDWLIASQPDKQAVLEKLGLELVDIDIRELIELASGPVSGTVLGSASGPLVSQSASGPASVPDSGRESVRRTSGESPAGIAAEVVEGLRTDAPEAVRKYIEGAVNIYSALRTIVSRYGLSGLTLRCFDLLDTLGNTGCLALALLNSEGIPAACEGDVPALLSMVIGNALVGRSGFQANPSQIDPTAGKMLLAHCTVPFNMVSRYSYDTHFESGIGVAIHGELPEGGVTIFKTSADLSRFFCEEAELLENQYGRNLCRTQVLLQMPEPKVLSDYFLKNPIGNHHIIFSGKHRAAFEEFMKEL